MVKFYSYKAEKTVKSSALAAYSIHSALLIRSLYHLQFLIENLYPIVGFLSFGTTEFVIFEEGLTGREEELEQEPASEPLESFKAPKS